MKIKIFSIPILIFLLVVSTSAQLSSSRKIQTSGIVRYQQVWLHCEGDLIKDEMGNLVWLKGCSISGLEWDATLSSHSLSWYNAAAFQDIRDIGFNAVRIPFSWAFIEPVIEEISETYLQKMDEVIGWAKSSGLYVILDFHQWLWNEQTNPGGTGMPSWVPDPDFWIDVTYQQAFYDMWKLVANRYKNESTVAAYSLMNEPWSSEGRDFVNQYYYEIMRHCVDEIESVDPAHICLIMPYAGWDVWNLQNLGRDNVVYSFHQYDIPLTSDNIEEWAHMKSISENGGVPVFVTEYGADNNNPLAESWCNQTTDAWESYGYHWFWWSYGRNDDGMHLLYSNGTYKPFVHILQRYL